MPPKSLFIHTIGCQMNVYDSERMAALLAPLGYGPALSAQEASLVIVNTCSVRDKAEQKAFSILGRLEAAKARRPGLIVAVAGCVAQQEGERVLARAPHVDIVVGTRGLGRLPELVRRVEDRRGPVVDIDPEDGTEGLHAAAAPAGGGPVARFVTIMRGCDNFCAYCVVPYVRGPETSRPPDSILAEIERLVAVGAREITLLGQNVNSYGAKEGLCTFAGLLERVNAVPGLLRIRFTTSHPKDLTPELIRAFACLAKLCPHIHLPVQSGSDRILERMNRRYNRERYLDIISKLRDSCSEIAITSDLIVGFPGETAADFEATLDLIRQVQFDGLFAFMYSDRPHATSARLSRKVPAAEKRERLQALLALQEDITFGRNRSLVGTLQEILVEGESKKQTAGPGADGSPVQWTGRTPGNKIVNFHCNPGSPGSGSVRPGRLVRVRIERALAHSLRGVHADEEAPGPKGDMNHAS